ncbi:16S rRNA (cytidine(1402)-2'-O)-methyltransferase [Octadecabacter sp. 1_MG-2023]|uniref:16S rRNA (cytidine(1402)-2'-O)-methyltransferase n=1 Tax=unclassified Octadecabacter TaxID=196158 RepID=UPI001C0839C7|nr:MULTISPECIES: 16S rRNA (cytidine(1402)-2'-O)-methyltransferase [unclassified Octadecabacter]MBU2991823.1 16S rRNA (cytidine(1402)-2'-O)-methyltransferase [Octadecabacter sp. B2R22]MDO6735797.1 16S rRNA (cytidine(1402)-2'-O)-methyltransferase [Octadecabacter sp. 1_MG-2023]
MNHRIIPLSAGLYLCAVPIGNARDVTLRTLDILASADVIAAEDTRTARKLMEIHGISIGDRPMVAYHDHSDQKVRDRIMGAVKDGKSVAYVSEAGTPLVADPGYKLTAAFRDADLPLTAAPGASAVLTALTVSGLPSDAFYFVGFLPNTTTARCTALEKLRDVQATLVLYESPRRVSGLLGDLVQTLGGERQVVICRELTKKFEEVLRGSAEDLIGELEGRNLKGEVVVLIERGGTAQLSEDDVAEALKTALKTMRIKDAATAVAGATGMARRDVYQLALSMKDDET